MLTRDLPVSIKWDSRSISRPGSVRTAEASTCYLDSMR
jgi:hypothetical protein